MTRSIDTRPQAPRPQAPAGRTDALKPAPSGDLERARRLILISLGFWLLIGLLTTGVQAGFA